MYQVFDLDIFGLFSACKILVWRKKREENKCSFRSTSSAAHHQSRYVEAAGCDVDEGLSIRVSTSIFGRVDPVPERSVAAALGFLV